MSFWLHIQPNWPGIGQKERKKNHSEYHFCPTRVGAFPKKFKKILKNFEKLKNMILASFLTKPTQVRLKRKKYFEPGTISAQPGMEYSQKNLEKKIVKINKHHFGFISSEIRLGQAEKEEKKFRSGYHICLTRARAFPKKF